MRGENSLIAAREIGHGGPGRDGIPALDTPVFLVGVDRDKAISRSARILGLNYNGVSKAYPIGVLDHRNSGTLPTRASAV